MIASLLISLLVVGQHKSAPQQLLGAEAVLNKMSAPMPAAKPSDAPPAIQAESDALRARLSRLSPKDAATAWLALAKHWESIKDSVTESYQPSEGWMSVLSALPGPQSWPFIQEGLSKLPAAKSSAIKAFLNDLLGNNSAILKYLEAKRTAILADGTPNMQADEIAVEELPIAQRAGDTALVSKLCQARAKAQISIWPGLSTLEGFVGRARMESIIRAKLEAATDSVQDLQDARIKPIARQVVLSDLTHLKAPQWMLVDGLGDYAFVAAQVSRFGEKSLDPSSTAGIVYGLGLAEAGKTDQAVRFFSNAKPDDNGGWQPNVQEDKPQWGSLFAATSMLLDRRPIPTLEPVYVQLGQFLGRSEDVFKRIDVWLAEPGISPVARQNLLGIRASLELASPHPESAVSDLEQAITIPNPYNVENSADRLIALGVETGNLDIVSFAAKAAASTSTVGGQPPFFDAYNRMGRLADAQNACLNAITDTHNVNTAAEGEGHLKYAFPGIGNQLAEVYYEAKQPPQVIALLDEYRKWGASDLESLLTQDRNDEEGRFLAAGRPLGFYAAWAFAQTGDQAKAVRILRALVCLDLKDDAPFELLNRLQEQALLPLYDRLIAAYPCETRPLMWKGDLLLKLGKPADAEKAVRAAIALDPTDLDAPTGCREAAYGILSRILRAEGKPDEADQCHKVVEAASLVERAHELKEYGIKSRAMEILEQAIDKNPKDFEAHLGYADILNELGRDSDAQHEYRIAAGLALSSEGPTGRRRYGWYFDRPSGGPFAEEVARLLKEHPTDPGLLTLAGDLSVQTGDDREALADYEHAVAANPKYLRAWQGITDLAQSGVPSAAQCRQAVLALIQLAPLGYVNSDAIAASGDFAALWQAYDRAYRLLPIPSSEPLYPLAASARSLKSGSKPAGETPQGWISEANSPPDLFRGPSSALSNLNELRNFFLW